MILHSASSWLCPKSIHWMSTHHINSCDLGSLCLYTAYFEHFSIRDKVYFFACIKKTHSAYFASRLFFSFFFFLTKEKNNRQGSQLSEKDERKPSSVYTENLSHLWPCDGLATCPGCKWFYLFNLAQVLRITLRVSYPPARNTVLLLYTAYAQQNCVFTIIPTDHAG